MIIAKLVYAILLGYILGAIPFGLLVAKSKSRIDVTKYGSGKIGATNVMRVVGAKAAALVALLDLLKGVLAVVVAGFIVGDNSLVIGGFSIGTLVTQVMAALAAIAGHNWSVFLKFHGGRGVATFFGGMIALCPPAALFGGEILILSAGLTRYVSLGSIAGMAGASTILIPLIVVNGFPIEYLTYALIGGIIIIFMHRDNIRRIMAGNERKLGEKAEKPNTTEGLN